MAIGDNIPSIFSNLAQSVINSNGDPMYLMDQFEGRDPDAEQQLRMGIMDGPPPPMEGSLLDQYLFATGDPNQATGMVINDIMARHDETVNTLDDAKIDTTASQLLNMFPATMPSYSLEIADEMGISHNNLATAYNDLKTNANLELLSMSGNGEAMTNNLRPMLTPDYISTSSPIADPYVPAEGVAPEETEMQRIIREWLAGNLSSTERRAMLEAMILKGLTPEEQQAYQEEGGVMGERGGTGQLRNLVNNRINEYISYIDKEGTPDETAVETDLNIFNDSVVKTRDFTPPDPLDSPEILHTPFPTDESITTGETRLPEYSPVFYEQGLQTQFDAHMQPKIENWFTPGTAEAYGRNFSPLKGNFFLQNPNSSTSPVTLTGEGESAWADFLTKVKPEEYSVMDWNKISPQWNKLIEYIGESGEGSSDVLERRADFSSNYPVLSGVIDSGSKNDAIALALARYYEGRPVRGSYANNAVTTVMSQLYDQSALQSMRTGESPTVAFLSTLANNNPERFGYKE